MFNLNKKAVQVGKIPRLRLHWATLRFSYPDEPNLETTFLDQYFEKNITHLRICHIYTIIFYLLAGLIDYFLFPNDLIFLFSVRFFIVLPIFVIGYIFTYSKYYRNYWQQISLFYILLTGSSFIVFTIIAEHPRSYDYYVGTVFCMIFGYTFIRERFIYASIAGLILGCSYLFVSAVIVKMPSKDLFHSNFYIILFNLLGMLIARHLEISARRDFYLEHRLEIEQNNFIELNNMLEHKVEERTTELEISNIQLSDKISELHDSEKERQRLQAHLQQVHKMEAIGTLAGGVAHDFNNLLMGVQGRVSLMSLSIDPSDENKEHLNAIQQYIQSATDLTRQLLGLSRGGMYDVKAIDLNELLIESSVMFGRTKKEIKIHTNFYNPSPIVDADKRQIEQALLNIYINAWQAMPSGGDLYLETSIVDLDETYCDMYAAKPGRYSKISITDSGIGMDAETRKRVFDPFFTTKEKGRGTGLGLASAYGIVKNHKGIITVYSEISRGSTFNIYLPLSEDEVSKEKSIDPELVLGNETILLVDDEDMIIEVGQAMLEKLGYNVIVAKDGMKAVETVKQSNIEISLVILDMIMPGMDGGEIFDLIREINPELPVMLASGYSINGKATRIMEKGCKGFIQKPFNLYELSQKIRSILDGG
jgi:two-component system cell cycle sensor histidine kinase/response regulator CckA